MLFVQLILQVCLATVNAQLKEGGAMGAVGGGSLVGGWCLKVENGVHLSLL